jgi:formate hydrogenlyase subunit 4
MQPIFPYLQGLAILAVAPILVGWINWCKACFTGRRRPVAYLLQPYRDLFKLLRVPATRSKPTSWVFSWTPWVVFLSYGTLLFTLPVIFPALLRADLILTLYLLGLARFTLSLAGLDSASSFGGLGSSREMFFHFLTETSLFSVIAGVFVLSGSAFVSQSLPLLDDKNLIVSISAIALFVAFFPVLLLETRRIPVDNPETHLELTMAGKAVELEFSGRDLALIEWGEMNKLVFMLALWMQLLILLPIWNAPLMIMPLFWLLSGAGLALWESKMPKMRLGQIPVVAQISLLFSLFAIVIRLFIQWRTHGQ